MIANCICSMTLPEPMFPQEPPAWGGRLVMQTKTWKSGIMDMGTNRTGDLARAPLGALQPEGIEMSLDHRQLASPMQHLSAIEREEVQVLDPAPAFAVHFHLDPPGDFIQLAQNGARVELLHARRIGARLGPC